MKVTKNITIDLNNPRRHVVHLMESGNQREIVLTLLKDGMPFDVSEGIGTATLVKGVGYIKANGVPGYYDWTSTDMAAVALATGTTNVWNVLIDEHATDVAGFAEIFVKFSLASGETLYSFPITLDVIRTSGGTTDPDKPYYHSTSFLLAGAQAAKTPAMSFPVGVDGDGKLWAEGGWSAEAKEALIACFEQVAWKTPYGQTYLSALETALYTEVHLVSITAAYEQDRPIYDTDSLDLVRLDLVVTANYSDGTTQRLADDAYTLTGTLVPPSSTITVGYEGKTAEISVIVTSILPTGYTRYDYIQRYNDNVDTSVQAATAAQILLKKYADMNVLSCEFAYKALDGYRAGRCLFGGRPTTGSASSYAFYAGTLYDASAGTVDDENALGYHLHGANSVPTPTATKGDIHVVKVTNPATSPSTIQVDNQTPVSVPWVNSNTINASMCLLTNPAGEGGSGYLSALCQQGYIKFFNQSNQLVGFYVVAVRDADNVIGMYDTVEGTFYTSSTASHSTIGNSNQKYKVGRWS